MAEPSQSRQPPKPRRVEVVRVGEDSADPGYRRAAPMGPAPLRLRRRLKNRWGCALIFLVLALALAATAWVSPDFGLRMTFSLMATGCTLLLGYALYYGAWNVTVIELDSESLCRRDHAKGMHSFNVATRSIEQVFAGRGVTAADSAHVVNVRLEGGDVARLMACDDDEEAAFIAFEINEWLNTHREPGA